MKGAEYIAEFLAQRKTEKVFLLNGGAASFMVDAIARNPNIDYCSVQHEQVAAMAGDAIWRISGNVGVVMATSGPGATNLVTGICCNWFDSIPCLYITGQVNLKHSEVFEGTRVRQFGFQETDIVNLVGSVTKYARQVTTAEELQEALIEGYNAAITGRMGPSLIDVPMDLQQMDIGDRVFYHPPATTSISATDLEVHVNAINKLFENALRPVVLFGAGVGLAGAEAEVEAWLRDQGVPVVASWSGSCYLQQDFPGYVGCIGVYGNRGANYVLQNCDALLVIGSRLDTRQRPGNPNDFAPEAKVHVIDVDEEELKKYIKDEYGVSAMDLQFAGKVLDRVAPVSMSKEWSDYVVGMKEKFYGRDISSFSKKTGSISPYAVIKKLNEMIDEDATVTVDVGAITCWFFQMFERRRHTVFSNGGFAPISYAIGASIGVAATDSARQVIMVIGDGGLQNNIQELQTIAENEFNIQIIVLNNYGYGIVKQFQDLYMDGRHEASGRGYSVPDLEKIANGYGIDYVRIDDLKSFSEDLVANVGPQIIDVTLHPNTMIEPKLELGRPINDQYPYVSDNEFEVANKFVSFERPGWMVDRIIME